MLKDLKMLSTTFDLSIEINESILDDVEKKHVIINRARGRVIEAAMGIEQDCETFISRYFFPQRTEKSDFFQSNIIRTDIVSFAGKRRLSLEIISKERLLTGKEKNELDRLFSKIIGYRNAFTHGTIVEESDGTKLRYSSGGPAKKLLSDEYFENINTDFKNFYSFWGKAYKPKKVTKEKLNIKGA
jgi:hypothetical protein